FDDVHYLMTPYRALMLARYNEERAAMYFQAIAQATTNHEIAVFAAELARDEREHMVWVDKWLLQYPPEDRDHDHDLDPPAYSS
ncbi:MAG: rubrerythrin, partial [Alphaproteobacteria bacterium]|nr:rubrerythrin [Alphaproteobacteria bacterium]